jgi:hypothetical protein
LLAELRFEIPARSFSKTAEDVECCDAQVKVQCGKACGWRMKNLWRNCDKLLILGQWALKCWAFALVIDKCMRNTHGRSSDKLRLAERKSRPRPFAGLLVWI